MTESAVAPVAVLNELFEQAPLAMALTEGPEHRIVMVNNAFTQLSPGIDREEVIGKTIDAIFARHPQREEILQAVDSVYLTGQMVELKEIEYITDVLGTPHQLFTSSLIKPYYSKEQPSQIAGLLIYASNSSEQVINRHQIQENIRIQAEKAEELETVIEHISDALIVTDFEARVITINSLARDYFGISAEHLGQTPDNIWPSLPITYYLDGTPLPREEWPDAIAQREKRAVEKELIYEKPDGSRLTLGSFSTPVLDSEQNIKLIVSVLRDIGPRLREEKQRQEFLDYIEKERSKLDAIIESIEAGLIVVDLEGRIMLVNRRCNEVLATTQDLVGFNLVGRSVKVFLDRFAVLVKEHEIYRQNIREAFRASPQRFKFEVSFGSPLNIDISVASFPIFDNNQQLIGMGALLNDVTRLNQMLKLRSQFVAIASHELRTPMTGVVGFAELLLNREVEPATRERWAQTIYNESLHVTHIIENMLNISKIEGGILELKRTFSPLSQTLQKVVNKVKTNYPDRDITLDFGDLNDNATRLLADENYLTEALVQIVDNALKFSPLNTMVELSLRQCTSLDLLPPNLSSNSLINLKDENQPWLLLSVRDYGVGIQTEDLENIFEPFYRSKNSPNGPVSGSGLGLPLARKLIELHNGRVTLESIPAEGTTFYIVLPQEGHKGKDE